MKIGIIEIELRCAWVHSLKEKRMVVKSINSKLKNKFNISVAEVKYNDVHQLIGIGICFVSNDSKQIDSITNNIINFVEENTDAEVINIHTSMEVY